MGSDPDIISAMPNPLSRRRFLSGLAASSVSLWAASRASARAPHWTDELAPSLRPAVRSYCFSARDRALLRQLIHSGCRFFLENSDSQTGLVKDRARVSGPDSRPVASISATGFGLASLLIAEKHGWLTREEGRRRIHRTLEFLHDELPQHHGFFHHFMDSRTGATVWNSEVSTIDTALLMAGVLACRNRPFSRAIQQWAEKLYHRVQWQQALDEQGYLHHGWRPTTTRLQARWEHYCEHMILYLLALGSPTHPIPPESWNVWTRPMYRYQDLDFIGSDAPLFVHQFSHAFLDFRHQRDAHAQYFANSAQATEAHRRFCIHLRARFPDYSEDLWGITASDTQRGYAAWGGPPEHGELDGTVVPCAAAGSLPFHPAACLRTLHHQYHQYGDRVWGRYGFADAFHPGKNWVNPDVIGIDVGVTVLMADNLLTGNLWSWMGQDPDLRQGFRRAGFRSVA